MPDDTIYKRSSDGKKLSNQSGDEKSLSFNNQTVAMKEKLLIGRTKDNDICLDDALVSRHHAIIEKIGNVYYLKDMGSTNGTYVNNNPLTKGKSQRIQADDVILIGKTSFTFH